MPELPEVETVRQTLRKNILGKKIAGITVFYERMIVGSTKEEFIKKLKGKTLLEIGRMGKYLYFEFSDDIYLISHLRMEGKYHFGVPRRSFECVQYDVSGITGGEYEHLRAVGWGRKCLTNDREK